MSKKIIAIIAAVVVVLGGAGAGAYYFLTSTPKNQYLLSEKEAYDTTNTYISERFKEELDIQNNMSGEAYKGELSLNAEVPGTVLSEMDIPESMVNSSEIKFLMANDPKSKTSQLAIQPTIASTEIGNIAWSADENFQYIEAPVLEEPLKFSNEAILEGLGKVLGESLTDVEGLSNDTLNLNTLMSATITSEEIDSLTQHYLKFVLEQLKDESFAKEDAEVDVFGEKKKLEKLTLKLTEKEMKDLIITVLEEAKKDKDLKEIVKKTDGTIDFTKEMDTLIKEAKDTKSYPAMESIIYVDGKTIEKRQLTFTEGEDEIFINADLNVGKDLKMKMVAGSPEVPEFLVIEGSSKGKDKVTDAYVITLEDMGTATIKNDESMKDKTRTDNMVVDLKGIEGEEFTFNIDQDLMTDVKNNKQTSKATVSFDMQGETIKFNVNADMTLKEAYKVDVKDAQDVNEMSAAEVTKIQNQVSMNLMGLLFSVSGGF